MYFLPMLDQHLAILDVYFDKFAEYSHFRNYAPPLDEKGGIITEKVFPVFSERVFRACFGLVI